MKVSVRGVGLIGVYLVLPVVLAATVKVLAWPIARQALVLFLVKAAGG